MEAAKEVDIFIFLFSGTLGMMILAGGVITFFMLYQRRLMHKQTELYDLEMKHKEELLHNNIAMLEAERRRIAKDLHDDIGNVFSTLLWKLQQLRTDGNGGQPEGILEDARKLITTGLSNTRTITYDMIPYGFDIFGLATTIQGLCDRLAAAGALEINFEHTDPLPALPDPVSLHIYRILQELAGNTIKYAAATRIAINLEATATGLQLSYQDNGCGFDLKGMDRLQGHGLRNIESRISMLKARYQYITAPGQGVTAYIDIPINDAL
ncbi:hypothetical protein HB364_18090 [Pseudoflavitalea sp. X16]|uniref:sensor histidine kinase n=1 Tax=Paraflavitalea devenefica TaxID=2716334 RepID=UPI0014232AD7|nr:ATP-binding protein [Paraflavitalea devenefica]NII27007.1 hypothetical protein [Paraflavitalea devenefica]